MTPSQAPLALFGTWKLAAIESSRPDLPHPASGTTTFDQQSDGIHYSAETIWSDGRKGNVTSVFQIDGKSYAVTGSAIADSVSFRLLDDRSLESKMNKGNLAAGTTRSTFSADRTTMYGHWELTAPDGTTITWETTSKRA